MADGIAREFCPPMTSSCKLRRASVMDKHRMSRSWYVLRVVFPMSFGRDCVCASTHGAALPFSEGGDCATAVGLDGPPLPWLASSSRVPLPPASLRETCMARPHVQKGCRSVAPARPRYHGGHCRLNYEGSMDSGGSIDEIALLVPGAE